MISGFPVNIFLNYDLFGHSEMEQVSTPYLFILTHRRRLLRELFNIVAMNNCSCAHQRCFRRNLPGVLLIVDLRTLNVVAISVSKGSNSDLSTFKLRSNDSLS